MLKEMLQINDFNQYQDIINSSDAVLFYFSHERCNVCKVLKPKIVELIEHEFPKIKIFYCDTVKTPEIAAQNSIFAVPTILVYFAGRESLRKSRNIGLDELKRELERHYKLIFE